MNKEKLIGTKTFFASMSANYATEDTYWTYHNWYNASVNDIWYFWPYNILSNIVYRRMKQRAVYLRARSIVQRDRAEKIMFEDGIWESKLED